MNKQTNTNEALKQYIVRISPLTGGPVLFDATSRNNGRLTAWVGKDEVEVGIDYYNTAEPMDADQAKQIAQAWAKQHNIPETAYIVRQRLPKVNAAQPTARKPRKLNDANLVLVKNDKKEDGQESNQDYRSLEQRKADELAAAAQALHDGKEPADEPKASASSQATADNPEGAVVKRAAEDKPRTKRKYERKENKKSSAAMRRYLREIEAATASSETILEAAVPSPDVPQATVDEAKLTAALKLAKIILEAGIL